MAKTMNISHDSVNRFLLRESYSPQDLFHEAAKGLNLVGGTLSVDDTTLDKPYSQYMELVDYFWSGKHHRTVKGLNVITVYYCDPQGKHVPVNYRVYDKSEGKTKNDYFLEMLQELLDWGLQPHFVTGDSWYSCAKNLKKIRNHQMGFMFGVASNRKVSVERGSCCQVQQLELPDDGLKVWLQDFGYVKLFRTQLKDQLRHYVLYSPEPEAMDSFRKHQFMKLHEQHWQIEQYHRAIKQVCHVERFQVRGKRPIMNHLFAALCSYVHLQQMRASELIETVYQLQRELFRDVVAAFTYSFAEGKEYLNPKFQPSVNA